MIRPRELAEDVEHERFCRSGDSRLTRRQMRVACEILHAAIVRQDRTGGAFGMFRGAVTAEVLRGLEMYHRLPCHEDDDRPVPGDERGALPEGYYREGVEL